MFDMGGTLEDLYSDQENERRTAHALYSILQKHGIETPYGEEALWERVYPQILAYKAESERTMMELKPEEIWPDYGFAGIPVDREKLIAASEEIAHMWEVTYFNRALRKHAKEMLRGLKELGLYVAAVSNTASLFQVFDTLEKYGVREYFDDITPGSAGSSRSARSSRPSRIPAPMTAMRRITRWRTSMTSIRSCATCSPPKRARTGAQTACSTAPRAPGRKQKRPPRALCKTNVKSR